MEISNAHHQAMSAHQLEQVLAGIINSSTNIDQQQEKKKAMRPNPAEHSLKCPRCDSTNTKFCYYNNYSLTQPRYFCKGCRRYWTHGGSLRNVPVGGGCRKNNNKRSTSSNNSPKKAPQLVVDANRQPAPPVLPAANDLSLSTFGLNPNPNPNPAVSANFLDVLRCGGGGGFVDSTAHNYVESSAGNNNMLFPFEAEGGHDLLNLGGTATVVSEGSNWIGHNVDDTTRDYWNNGVGPYWHGFFNSSSLM